MILVLVISGILVIVAGVSDGIRDALAFRFNRTVFAGLNDQFWNPEISWRNKYRDGNPARGPRFFLSTTVLVFLTDGWHLMQFFHLTSYQVSLALLAWKLFDWPWWTAITAFAAAKLLFSAAFVLFFNHVIVRNETDKAQV